MPFGIFFGSEFEFFREKLQKILNGIHNPFWFFSKPPGNTSTYFWKVLKIVTQLRKEEGFTENETEDFIWNAKGLELRVLIYLDNSRYKGPYLVLDLREKLESFSEMFQEVNQVLVI